MFKVPRHALLKNGERPGWGAKPSVERSNVSLVHVHQQIGAAAEHENNGHGP
jgi:hypothetical protein